MTLHRPGNEAETAETIAWAATENASLEIIGGGSKRQLGRAVTADYRLDLSRLSGVIDYDPPELVLTAQAATPMAQIEAELAARAQMLAFEPPGWHALFGQGSAAPTLGGTMACNLAGPRRVRAGAARDHLLGFSAVNGWGEVWKAGGRVVKNVTGYDLCKLHCGAFGTLSALTQISVRVAPRPDTTETLVLAGLDDDSAIIAMAAALNAPQEVSAAAHLPAHIAARAQDARGMGAVTALRLEGHAPSVRERALRISEMFTVIARLDTSQSLAFWNAIGSVHTLLPPTGRVVWRICPTPSLAASVIHRIRKSFNSAEFFYDWGGGQVWLSLDEADSGADAGAALIRAALAPAGGHATLVVAPAEIRAATEVFEPAAAALEALAARVKAQFDPRHVLNPGRIRQGR